MKTYQKIIIITVIILIPGVIFLGFLSWTGNPDKIIAAADRFQPPASWELVSENINPPQTLCWEGGGCPYVHRVWQTSDSISKDEFVRLLQTNGWDFPVEKDCSLPENVSGSSVSVCSAHGIVDNFDVAVWLSINSSNQNDQKFTLSVEPMR